MAVGDRTVRTRAPIAATVENPIRFAAPDSASGSRDATAAKGMRSHQFDRGLDDSRRSIAAFGLAFVRRPAITGADGRSSVLTARLRPHNELPPLERCGRCPLQRRPKFRALGHPQARRRQGEAGGRRPIAWIGMTVPSAVPFTTGVRLSARARAGSRHERASTLSKTTAR